MKKTNFVVVFFLIMVIVCFISFLTSFNNFLESVSYVIVPATSDEYMTVVSVNRSLITTIPMMIFTGGIGVFCFKKGLVSYKEATNEASNK